MSELSIELLKDPFNIIKWNNLLQSSDLHANKTSSPQKIEAIRSIYTDFLKIYPLLENYWLKYIEFEFELSNFEECTQVYDAAFRYLSYSPNLWVKYLNFKILAYPITQDNCMEYLKLFETARGFIGCNYYAADFYKLYLSFLQEYKDVDASLKFDKKYEVLLRFVIEVPLYGYGHFFKVLLEALDKGLQHVRLSKKNITDIYIVTQSKVFRLYEYEKNLVNYFNLNYVSNNELAAWSKYLQYLEVNYSFEHTVQAYERSIIRTSNYDDLYVQYCNYLISCKKIHSAIEVLKRGLSARNFNKSVLTDKLVDLNMYKSNYVTAKSLEPSTSLPKLVNLEWLFKNQKVVETLFKMSQPWELLLYYDIDDTIKLKLFKSKDIERNDAYYNVLNLWLKLKPQYKKEFEVEEKTFDEELETYL